jgi:outer membrane protein TolC
VSDADREAAIRERAERSSFWRAEEYADTLWLLERLAAERARADAAEEQLRAATDIIIEAEKIVPGLASTAGLFAIGDVAEARAERDALAAQVEQLRRELEQVLDALDALGLTPMPEGAAFGVAIAMNIARSALAASPGPVAPSEPLRGAAEAGKP